MVQVHPGAGFLDFRIGQERLIYPNRAVTRKVIAITAKLGDVEYVHHFIFHYMTIARPASPIKILATPLLYILMQIFGLEMSIFSCGTFTGVGKSIRGGPQDGCV